MKPESWPAKIQNKRAEADRKTRAEALAKQQAEAEKKSIGRSKKQEIFTNTPPAEKKEEESRIVGANSAT